MCRNRINKALFFLSRSLKMKHMLIFGMLFIFTNLLFPGNSEALNVWQRDAVGDFFDSKWCDKFCDKEADLSCGLPPQQNTPSSSAPDTYETVTLDCGGAITLSEDISVNSMGISDGTFNVANASIFGPNQKIDGSLDIRGGEFLMNSGKFGLESIRMLGGAITFDGVHIPPGVRFNTANGKIVFKGETTVEWAEGDLEMFAGVQNREEDPGEMDITFLDNASISYEGETFGDRLIFAGRHETSKLNLNIDSSEVLVDVHWLVFRDLTYNTFSPGVKIIVDRLEFDGLVSGEGLANSEFVFPSRSLPATDGSLDMDNSDMELPIDMGCNDLGFDTENMVLGKVTVLENEKLHLRGHSAIYINELNLEDNSKISTDQGPETAPVYYKKITKGAGASIEGNIIGCDLPLEGDNEKAFTFNCDEKFIKTPFGLDKLILELGENEECVLKLTNTEPGIPVNALTNARKGLRPTINVEPASGATDNNGELKFTINATGKGVDWIAWATPNENGEIKFGWKAFKAGNAWGMFVKVK